MSVTTARSFARQQTLFAPETEAGVPETTGFKAWGAIKAMPGWDGEAEPFMGGSSKFATTANPTDESSAISIEMTPDFNHLGFVAASRLCIPETTVPGGGSISRQHVFDVDPDREDSRRTYTILYGDPWQAQEIAYAVFNTLGMDIQRGQVDFSSSMIGRSGEFGEADLPGNAVYTLTKNGTPTTGTYTINIPGYAATATQALTDNAAAILADLIALAGIGADDVSVSGGPINTTPVVITFRGALGQKDMGTITAPDTFDTGSVDVVKTVTGSRPEYVEEVPIPSILWDVYGDDEWDDLGVTQLLAAYQGAIDLQDKFEKDSPIDSSVRSFKNLLEAAEQGNVFNLVVGVDATAVALQNSFKAGEKKFIRMEVEGPIIEGAIRYKCTVDFCILILGRGEISAAPNSPVVSIPLSCVIARDFVSSKAFRLTLINTVESY